MSKNNILLIGMPGSGKSTTGVVLAKLVGYDFIDTDLVMAKKLKTPLPLLAKRLGYEGFLKEESAVGEALCCSHSVIATGGSMPLSEKAMTHLSEISTVVWLRVSPQTLEKRIPADLTSRGVVFRNGQKLEDIMREREPFYAKYADLVVDCCGGCDEVAGTIIRQLEEKKL